MTAPSAGVSVRHRARLDVSGFVEVSVRELRNQTGAVVAAVRAGERVSLTVNRLPMADIVPHQESRSPWVPAAALRAIVEDAATDTTLLDDLAAVRDQLIDEP